MFGQIADYAGKWRFGLSEALSKPVLQSFDQKPLTGHFFLFFGAVFKNYAEQAQQFNCNNFVTWNVLIFHFHFPVLFHFKIYQNAMITVQLKRGEGSNKLKPFL